MYIGVEISAKTIRVGAFHSLQDESPKYDSFAHHNNYRRDLKRLIKTIDKLRAKKNIDGIGLSCAGLVSADQKRLLTALSASSWAGEALADTLEERFDCPVRLINDTAASALAEANHGDRHHQFWFIIWGTGIGGALFSDDRVYPAEPGHHSIDPNGPYCVCGGRGCLEAYCGGAAIERAYDKPASKLADDEWQEVLNYLSIGIANITTIQPASLVVLGGAVSVAQSHFIPELEEKVAARLTAIKAPHLRLARFTERASMIGAVSQFTEKPHAAS
jgi:predicted NBD/HSP70 family sugar kinase